MSEPVLSPLPASNEVAIASAPACALCATALPEGIVAKRVNGAEVCEACAGQIAAELAAEQGSFKDYPLAIGLGLGAAIVSAMVWTAIVVVTNYEVGYVAVGVGFLTGIAVKFGAGLARNKQLQILAAALSVFGLFLAKYFTFAYHFVGAIRAEGEAMGYFDPMIPGYFAGALTEMLSPFDLLWVVFAVLTAYKIPAPSSVALEDAA